jgi:hypothetical protein
MTNLRPWFIEDIENALRSALYGVRDNPSYEYEEGFLACAIAIILAVGGNPNDLRLPTQRPPDRG